MRVLIADDHRLIAEGIRRALDDTDDFEVVGEANRSATSTRTSRSSSSRLRPTRT